MADADHLPGHTVIDLHDGRIQLSYRRPDRRGMSDEFVRLLYTPEAALALAAELTDTARSVSPKGSEGSNG
ncbi:hypothetical protein [Azospirillum sp. B2RO_4]|uniref:hypothetical protein n=1 Tax=Azospirillum sp. B2RO_4 TaxID=3027796 RepID=UPI003DA95E4A